MTSMTWAKKLSVKKQRAASWYLEAKTPWSHFLLKKMQSNLGFQWNQVNESPILKEAIIFVHL